MATAYELGSARSYYGMSESVPYEQAPQKPSSGYRTVLVVLAIVFGVLISVSVIAAIVLVFMQEPVDVSKLRSVNVNGRKHSFRSTPSYKEMSFSDLLTNSGSFKTEFYSLWLGDSLAVFDAVGNLKIVNDSQRMGYGLPLANAREFKPGQRAQDAIFNSDQRLVALSSDVRLGFRHSRKAMYEVASVELGRFGNHQSIGPIGSGSEPLQVFKWNPAAGARDFVFVYENNIYYQTDYMFAQPLPVTTTGNEHKYHGVADWLYEEEIFSDSTALWWSSNGEYLAYASFDDKNVTSVRVPYYEPGVPYPRYNQISYPKAGVDRQPTVFLWIWDKANNATKLLLPPEELFALDDAYYLFSASWLQYRRDDGIMEEVLTAVWSNRLQNENYRQSFSVNDKNLWAEPADLHIHFKSKTGYFVLLPHMQADRRIYNHVAHVRIEVDNLQKGTITGFHGGTYDVSEVVGYDAERDELFYLAPGERPEERHLYRVVKATEQSGLEPYCVSCRIPECRTAEAKFSPSGRRFVLVCSAPYIATRAYLKESANVNPDHVLAELHETVPFDLPAVKFMQVTLDDRFESSVRLILPPELDPTSSIKYPLLVLVYAGPGSNAARAQTPWSLLTYFASKRRYVIASIDGRGSGGRGWDVKAPVYRNLGGPEVDDQIATVIKLKQLLPYLDDKAVGVFGWSYGGFVSAHIAGRDAGRTFPCVAAIAAVTDYRLYDTAYTERYMGLLGNNTSGYERSNVLNNVTGFQHVDFLLAHGEADGAIQSLIISSSRLNYKIADNVHYQNSALLAYALQERGIHFKQLVYTNQDHSIATARPHLYRELDMFFDECFKTSSSATIEPSPPASPPSAPPFAAKSS